MVWKIIVARKERETACKGCAVQVQQRVNLGRAEAWKKFLGHTAATIHIPFSSPHSMEGPGDLTTGEGNRAQGSVRGCRCQGGGAFTGEGVSTLPGIPEWDGTQTRRTLRHSDARVWRACSVSTVVRQEDRREESDRSAAREWLRILT